MKDETLNKIVKEVADYWSESKTSRKFDAVYLGKFLHKAKGAMSWGQWAKLCRKLPFTKRTAYNYISIYLKEKSND